MNKWGVLATLSGIIIVVYVLIGYIMSNVEHPKYKVISAVKNLNIEIRQYKPMITAEVVVKGTQKETIKAGFRILANYIFGNNDISTRENLTEKKSKKIAMTAPVEQQELADGYLVRFIMPSSYTLNDLPKPVNKQIKIKETPQENYVCIMFFGSPSEYNLAKYEKILSDYIAEQHLKTEIKAKYAFYNPPWVIPTLRRNEIMFLLNET